MGAQPTNEEIADAYYKWLGIPKSEQPPNAYRLLGIVLFEPDGDVIQAAADRQMAHVRTYQTGKHSAISQQILNEVSAAKLRLLRPEKRGPYDEGLRQQLTPAAAPAPKSVPIPLRVPEAPPAPQSAPIPLRIPEAPPAPAQNAPDSNPFVAITEMDRAALYGKNSSEASARPAKSVKSTPARRPKAPNIAIAIGIAAAGVAAVVAAIVIVSSSPQDEHAVAPAVPDAVPTEPRETRSYDVPMPTQNASRGTSDSAPQFGNSTPPQVPNQGLSGRAGGNDGAQGWSGVKHDPLPTAAPQVPQPPLRPVAVKPNLGQPAPTRPTDYVGTELVALTSRTKLGVPSVFHLDFKSVGNEFDKLLADKLHGVVYRSFPSRKFEYVGSEIGGSLDGIALFQYEDGQPDAYAEYDRGELNGNLMAWRPDGTRWLFAQFSHGWKNGFLCLFDEQGALGFVQELNHDQPKRSYLIRDGRVAKAFSHPKTEKMDFSELLAEAEGATLRGRWGFSIDGIGFAEASEAEATTLRLRGRFRTVKKAAIEYEEEQRAARAAVNSAANRQRFNERESDRANAQAELFAALHKWSGM